MRSSVAVVTLTLGGLFAVIGCRTSALPTSTLGEAVPPGGIFHLTLEPTLAPRDLVLRYFAEGQAPSSIRDSFVAGEAVVVDRPLLPGTRGIELDGEICEGRYVIASDVETDIVLTPTPAGCKVTTVGTHVAGEIDHANSPASLYGQAPSGTSVEAESLDPAVVVPVQRDSTDESGSYRLDDLPAGRYEVRLLRGDLVLGKTMVELRAGEERQLSLGGTIASPSP